MDKPVLIIEMPKLDDKAAVDLQRFLQELTNAFETHYLRQIKRYYQKLYLNEADKDLF
jgi:hypothetical protein